MLTFEEPYEDPYVLRELYVEQGLPMTTMGEMLGCSRYVIKHRLDLYDITRPYEKENVLRLLYWDYGLSSVVIGDMFGTSHQPILNRLDKFGIEKRKCSRDKPPLYTADERGYVYWRHHDGVKQRQVYVHRLLGVAKYGFEEMKDKDIHHVNGTRWDNRPENIEKITKEDHGRLHGKQSPA